MEIERELKDPRCVVCTAAEIITFADCSNAAIISWSLNPKKCIECSSYGSEGAAQESCKVADAMIL
jgi:hypothetical protein